MTQTPPPKVSGMIKLNDNWRLALPGPFNQKVEGDALVLWNDDLTIWTKSYINSAATSINDRINHALETASENAKEVMRQADETSGQISYRLLEDATKGAARGALYTYTFSEKAHLSAAFYGKDEDQIRIARGILATIQAENA